MAGTFERIADWLQRVALVDASLEDLIEGLSSRLRDAGIPVARISMGRILMHPVIGIVDVTWDADARRADNTIYPRSAILASAGEKSPFVELGNAAHAAASTLRHLRGLELADAMPEWPYLNDDLNDPATRGKYPLYGRLAATGMTGYVAFVAPFGLRPVTLGAGRQYHLGATVSYATRRQSGFTEPEIAGFRRINLPLMSVVRLVTEKFFVSELVEAYLGRISGQSVLSGQIARGDVRRIDCALFFSDMRGSTLLSQRLPPEDYVAALNRYFDCVAGAVIDHGGEVLKFMGDGLLAIFPFDRQGRTPEDICANALSAAREAFHRRNALDRPDLVEFGIGLHAGEVIYGNVGTEKRLDFTVIGTSVAKASRVEGLTRVLDTPLLATTAFAAFVPESARHLGTHRLRGFDEEVEVASFDLAG